MTEIRQERNIANRHTKHDWGNLKWCLMANFRASTDLTLSVHGQDIDSISRMFNLCCMVRVSWCAILKHVSSTYVFVDLVKASESLNHAEDHIHHKYKFSIHWTIQHTEGYHSTSRSLEYNKHTWCKVMWHKAAFNTMRNRVSSGSTCDVCKCKDHFLLIIHVIL